VSFLDLVKQRRSVRNFLDKPVEREKILTCIEAARLAPSACNSQPWKFIVIDDPKIRDRICNEAFGALHFFNAFLKTAPVIVVIVSEKSKYVARLGGAIQNTKYYLLDIGIAGEHLVLQAQELGLGTCWLGWFKEKAAKLILGVPKDRKIDVMIALGYYNEETTESEQIRHPINDIVSFNGYTSEHSAE
jgi:nitroreductase